MQKKADYQIESKTRPLQLKAVDFLYLPKKSTSSDDINSDDIVEKCTLSEQIPIALASCEFKSVSFVDIDRFRDKYNIYDSTVGNLKYFYLQIDENAVDNVEKKDGDAKQPKTMLPVPRSCQPQGCRRWPSRGVRTSENRAW